MWLVRRGERVTQGETLLEIVAENVMIELPAQRSGRVLEKLVAEDERLAPGQRLAIIEIEE